MITAGVLVVVLSGLIGQVNGQTDCIGESDADAIRAQTSFIYKF